MQKKIIAIVVILVIALICIFIAINNNDKNKDVNENQFELNTVNKYKVITDMRWNTMRNDGGSNTSMYYYIDLDNKVVSQVIQDYQANLGGIPQTTTQVIYTKQIDSNTRHDMQLLLNNVLEKEDVNETKNYNFYTIETVNKQKDIYNIDTIKQIEEMLKSIDEK